MYEYVSSCLNAGVAELSDIEVFEVDVGAAEGAES